MTLGDYYKNLGDDETGRTKKRDLIFKISMKIEKEVATIHNYINGRRKPVKLEREAIAKIVGMPACELFPEKQHA